MATLSVIIVTKNEAHNIRDCLTSVAFADEIVLYDCGSVDGTPDIARRYGAKVVVTDWPGDGPQKNRALNDATCDWVLCLDADERVSPKLAQEIQDMLDTTHNAGFILPFQSTYCGKPIRFGDWAGEKHLRLFKRTQGGFSNHIVHCHTQVDGPIGTLKHKIIHHPFHTLEALLHKMNDYSTQSALRKYQQGKRASLWTALSHGLWTFIRGYFLKLGFLDGAEGFLLAMSNAQGTYYRYLKIRLLARENKHDAARHAHVPQGS